MEEAIKSVIEAEREVARRKAELEAQYPQVFSALKQVEDVEREIAERKSRIKDRLIEDEDFDNHIVDGVNVSLSKVVNCDVEDINLVPQEFKSIETIVNLNEVKNVIKATGKIPAGIRDKITFRFNWKEVKNG